MESGAGRPILINQIAIEERLSREAVEEFRDSQGRQRV